MLDVIAAVLAVAGVAFFVAGTIGLLRFPDVYTRLHALTKADNVGVGLIAAAAVLRSPTFETFVKAFLIWIFVMVSGAVAGYQISHQAARHGVRPWSRQP